MATPFLFISVSQTVQLRQFTDSSSGWWFIDICNVVSVGGDFVSDRVGDSHLIVPSPLARLAALRRVRAGGFSSHASWEYVMPRHWKSHCLFVVCVAAFAGSSCAGALSVPQVIVKGDVTGYAQSKLPLPGPVVVYVYASSGALVAVIRAHGGHNDDALRKVEDAIGSCDFHEFESPELSGTAAALKEYLFDQGHRVEDLVSKKTPYTLLLTVMDLDNPACASALKLRDQYAQALHLAAEKPSVRGAYTVGMLELSSSTVKIECKK